MSSSQIDEAFGNSLKLARTLSGLSQEDLASNVTLFQGITLSQATIGKIERGERKVSVGEAFALADALDVSVSDLAVGKSSLQAEELSRRLSVLRTALIESIRDFESGQQVVARLAEDLAPQDAADLAYEVLESAEEVLSLYRHETVSDHQIFKNVPDAKDGGKLLVKYYEKFGQTVETSIRKRAAEVITGPSKRDSDSDSGNG